MAVYSACPLLQPDSVRLILLHPAADPGSDIRCELFSISLSSTPQDNTFSYTTLSYAWGDPKAKNSIFISDETLEIGANLFSALQNLRRQDRPIRLWVDAISINQNDSNERSQQVQQMRTIYATASETVIYLGPDDGSVACRSAWNLLELRSSWAMNDHRNPDKTLPKKREKDVNFKTGFNDVLDSVMSREWFNRIWVIQEMVVSQQLSIQCGDRRIPWNDFCRTLFLYFSPLHSTAGYIPQTDSYSEALGSLRALTSGSNSHITEIRPGWEAVARNNPGWKDLIQPVKEMCQTRLLYQRTHRNPDIVVPKWVLNDPLAHFVADDTEFRQGSLRLAHLLAKSRKFHATDPRDKTFALLGISSGLNSKDVETLVDYNKPDHQTYREMTRFILEAENTFDILSQAGQSSLDSDLDFSSWAGRWSERGFPPISALTRLGGESDELTTMRSLAVSQHHTWSEDGKIFGCTGGIMGELVAIRGFGSSSPQSKTSVDDSATWFWDKFIPSASSIVQESSWTLADKDVNFSTSKTITDTAQGHFHVSISPHSTHESEQNPVKRNIFIAGGGGFLNDVYALREGRKLAIIRSVPYSLDHPPTDDDAVYSWGVVPKSAEVGNWVATITGCRVLFLMYPQPEGDERHDAEEGLRARLPNDGDKDAEIIHCRLRGECRFSGFEDMWEPWEMSEKEKKRPWMTYIGYYPRQFRSAIFAVH
jgi:hypothetical protein